MYVPFPTYNKPYRALIRPVWDNVYGFDYTAMKEVALAEPIVDVAQQIGKMAPGPGEAEGGAGGAGAAGELGEVAEVAAL